MPKTCDFSGIFVGGRSWIAKDFDRISLSNGFFVGGAIAMLISLASGMGHWENFPIGGRCYASVCIGVCDDPCGSDRHPERSNIPTIRLI